MGNSNLEKENPYIVGWDYTGKTMATSTCTTSLYTIEDCNQEIEEIIAKLISTKWYEVFLRNKLIKRLNYWVEAKKNLTLRN